MFTDTTYTNVSEFTNDAGYITSAPVDSVAGKTGVVTLAHTDITDYDTELAGTTNTTAFTPTADYHPATKKYVDDNAGGGGTGLTLYDGVVAGEQIVGKVFEVPVQGTATASKFKVSLGVAPSGTDFICKLYKNGVEDASVTIATTATATNGLYIGNDTTFVSGSYVENDRLTVEVTQIGSTVSGSDLTFAIS